MSINDGGPAFPMPSGAEPRQNETTHYNEGMTLRDWFAGLAMQGFCANGDPASHMHAKGITPEACRNGFAKSAYAMADEMIAARELAK